MPTKSTYQQTDLDKGTQTATSGFHVCTGDDKEVTGSPKRYVNAVDHKIRQVKAVRYIFEYYYFGSTNFICIYVYILYVIITCIVGIIDCQNTENV